MPETDWMWVYENPKDAAAMIDRLRRENDVLRDVIRVREDRIKAVQQWLAGFPLPPS